MDDVEASLVLYRSPEEVYELLFEFERYRRYSEHVEAVRIRGDGVGARFAITLSWWRLTYTVRGRVTGVDRPERIEWTITEDVDASGYWSIEPVPEEAPPDRETATRARLHVEFDRSSARAGALDLGPLLPMDRVLSKVIPLVKPEADRMARRAVADVEGEPRPVELVVHEDPDTL